MAPADGVVCAEPLHTQKPLESQPTRTKTNRMFALWPPQDSPMRL